LYGHGKRIFSLLELENGDLVSSSQDGHLRVFSMTTGQVTKSIDTRLGSIIPISLMNDGNIAAGYEDGIISITGLVVKSIKVHDVQVVSLVTLSNNNLAIITDDSVISIWNANGDGQIFEIFSGQDACVILALPDERLVVGDEDGRLSILNATTGNIVKHLTAGEHTDCVNTLLLLNETIMANGSIEKTIKIWDLSSGQCL
jgi:WD40 repeat protein